MRHVYMAYSMTVPNGTLSSMKALACWLRKEKKYRVFEPSYELFLDGLAERALERLDSSFLVVADISQASNGVGFEIGYAFSRGKRVIIVAQDGCEDQISKFLSTLFPDVITFVDAHDLIKKVAAHLNSASMK